LLLLTLQENPTVATVWNLLVSFIVIVSRFEFVFHSHPSVLVCV
jgi:predicted secreted protein